MLTGGCHCGAIRYELNGDPVAHLLCHCSDCQRTSGAPMVGWIMITDDCLTVTGEPAIYASSESGKRYFCIQCGTGLFYSNEVNLPGMVDIQSATLDEPSTAQPSAHIQIADQISWMQNAHELPKFDRWPDEEDQG
ncbi:MAG: GFA family protein [Erythrobacter sp.]